MPDTRAQNAAGPAREELVFPAPGMCFGCSPVNAAGLRLRFFREGRGVRCETTVGATHQGALDVVHGGIQAVLLDEASCAAAFFTTGGYVVTGALDLRYRRPCRSDVPLTIYAELIRDEERFVVVAAEIRDVQGDVLTTSEGRFYRDSRRNAP